MNIQQLIMLNKGSISFVEHQFHRLGETFTYSGKGIFLELSETESSGRPM
jgi:hypothetical protein